MKKKAVHRNSDSATEDDGAKKREECHFWEPQLNQKQDPNKRYLQSNERLAAGV